MSDRPPPTGPGGDGGWRRTAARVWHWSVLIVCIAGIAASLRFTWTAWATFQTESETGGGGGLLWLAIAAMLILLAGVFAWEALQRVKRLRR